MLTGSRRSIGLHLSLAAAAAVSLAAGCEDSGGGGGGPCGAPGSTGTVTFTFQGQPFTATCFQAVASGGSLTFTSATPAAGRTAAVMRLQLPARDSTGAVCPWHPGATALLAGGCVDLLVQGQTGADAGAASAPWTASSGTPTASGAILVSDWATAPGQLASVSFSLGASVTSDGGTQIPISGSATTLTAAP
ncbi:MAG TPA: hypothetical protein VND93_14010 [Myxococcales bacterium]|nr:hypothetical protein [Myxococcales bacterium]